MKWQHLMLLLLLAGAVYGQTSNRDTLASTYTIRGGNVGLDLTAIGEKYPGLRITWIQGLTDHDLLDLDIMHITQGNDDLSVYGFSSTLQYKRLLLANSVYLGAGAKYMSTVLETDIILRRLDGVFFQELAVEQSRKATLGVFSIGGLINLGTGVFIDFEYQYYLGSATISRIDGVPPGSELEVNQDLDPRFVYNTVGDIKEPGTTRLPINLNVSFIFELY